MLKTRFSLSTLAAALVACAFLATPARGTMPPRSGIVPPELAQAFQSGALQVPAHEPPPEDFPVSAIPPVWRVPVVLVSYSDSALVHTAAEFNHDLFDTTHSTATGSLYDYYQWVSGGRLRVIARVVATVTLPGSRRDYGGNSWGLNLLATPNNAYGVVHDALALCDGQVDWRPYDNNGDGFVDMVWVAHAGIGGEGSLDRNNLWSIFSQMSSGWSGGGAFVTNDTLPGSTSQTMRIDRFSIAPELSVFQLGRISEIGVYCHEFGHALGLPDLYDTSGSTNTGPGNWSLMSTGVYGGDSHSPEYPVSLTAWELRFLGWRSSVRPTRDTLMTLDPLERGAPTVEFWFQGAQSSEHFLIENRHREGFDRNLPWDGLVLYQIEEAVIGIRLAANRVNAGMPQGLRLVEADGRQDLIGGANRGEDSDPFPGAMNVTRVDDDTSPNLRSITGSPTNLALKDIARVGASVRFLAQVRAPGWLLAEDHTEPAYQPVNTEQSSPRAVRAPDGTLYTVWSEARAGRIQVVLRAKRNGAWEPSIPVSASTGAALEPGVALLPGGDLAVTWSDTRAGASQIYYRARIRGTWTPECLMSTLPGLSRSPALATDPRGMVYLVWLYTGSDGPRVLFMRFPYLSPFGQPTAVSPISDLPGSPALAVGRDGVAYVLWSNRAQVPQAALYFARVHPDSGVGARNRLGWLTNDAQTTVSALVDSAGSLHTVWQQTGPGTQEIHYQCRPLAGIPNPRDTVIENSGSEVLNPLLAMDPQGTLHVLFEASDASQLQLRYKRWQRGKGWDYRSTEITTAAEGSASIPSLVPTSSGNVTVLYENDDDQGSHFLERRRVLDGEPAMAVEAATPAPPTFAVLPNPLRRGEALMVRYAAATDDAGPGVIDVFDVAGRLVGSVRLDLGARLARLDPEQTARWPGGLYFARVRNSRSSAARFVVLR